MGYSVTEIDFHYTQITCRICAVSFTPNSLGTLGHRRNNEGEAVLRDTMQIER